MQSPAVTESPSLTAEAVCFLRAAEQRRPKGRRILDDPYARWFLGPLFAPLLAALELAGPLATAVEDRFAGLSTWVPLRHRFIDDGLAAAIDEGAAQVAILGAGYDTRALRFAGALEGRPVFELDFPSTSRRKGSILDAHRDELPRVDLRRVEIDFLSQRLGDALAGAGFEANRPTFFAWEGVSMYLTRDAVEQTLADVRRLGAPGSLLAMDFWHYVDTPGLLGAAYRAAPGLLTLVGESITLSVHPRDVASLMSGAGFDVVEQAAGDELARRYGAAGRRVDPANHVVLARSA